MSNIRTKIKRLLGNPRRPALGLPFTNYSQMKMDGNWAIETASFCNRSCPFCPGSICEEVYRRRFEETPAGPRKRKIRIPLTRIISLLDQIRELTTADHPTILPFALNEPYEDERIVDILKAIKEREFRIYIVSNGDAFRNHRDRFREAFGYLDHLKLGIYIDPTTRAGQKRIRQQRQQFQAEYDQFVRDTGNRPKLEFSICSTDFQLPHSFLPRGRALYAPCYPNTHGFRQISAFGDLSICCKDNSWAELGGVCLGNIFRSSLKDLLFSERHLEVLNLLREGRRNELFRCSTCFGAVGTKAPADDLSYWKVKRSGKDPQTALARHLETLTRRPALRGGPFDFSDLDFSYTLPSGLEAWNEEIGRWAVT